MRVILAALFVVSSIAAIVGLLAEMGFLDRAPAVVGFGLALLMLSLCVVAWVVFNPWWADPLGRLTTDELLRRLRSEGLLTSSEFQARRAFGVRELEDEGRHYFLELIDGRVLYLSGQYLYDYEPITDDPSLNQQRRFPCTDFTLLRHKTEGYVIELICRGRVIEPEFIAPPMTSRIRRLIGEPTDSQVLSDRPYDLLKELLFGDGERPRRERAET